MARNKEFDYERKLEIVRNLFWEKGYQATSMQEIVDSMELNRSSIYNTYGSKHKLFISCLKNYAQLKTAQYKDASKTDGNAFDKLVHVVHDVVNQTIKDKKTCLIVRTIFELGDSDEAVNTLIKSNAIALESIFIDLLTQAKQEKLIKDSIDPTLAGRYILASFSGFHKHYIVSGNKKEVTAMIDFMLDAMKD